MTKKRIMKDFKMTEISVVDRPAQAPAKMTIMKRDENAIAKYYGDTYGAQDFDVILENNKKQKRLWEAREELYPLFTALQDSVSSIVTDANIDENVRQTKIENSVNSFLSAVRDVIPEVEEELMKVFEELNKAGSSGINNPDEGVSMSEEVKKTEDLEKALAEATAKLEKAEKTIAEMKAEEDKKKKKDEMAKNDETLVVAGQTIAKSEVGEGQFAIFKAQADAIAKAEERIAKAEEAAEFARLEKRAADEFKHLPGTASDHAKMLKAIDGLADKDVAKAFEGLMKAHDLAKAEAFKSVGFNKSVDESVTFDSKVSEIQKRDNVSKARAMELAAQENPELVEAIR